jgi:hypothetical protein
MSVRCRATTLRRWRGSLGALGLAALAWAAGCGTAQPRVEPAFAARTYTPGRIALLPPVVFMNYDEVGDNDPQKAAALRQQVSVETIRLVAGELKRRGYDVNVQYRWDGIFGGGGEALVSTQELARLGHSVVMFTNSEQGGEQGPVRTSAFVAPEVASKIGWATQSDAILYVNMKGRVVSPGKMAGQIIGSAAILAFFVLMILLLTQNRGGGGGAGAPRGGGGAPVAGGGGGPTAAAVAPAAGAPTTAAVAAPRGRGSYRGGGGGRVYRSPPRTYTSVGVGVGVVVPIGGGGGGGRHAYGYPPPGPRYDTVELDGPRHTHDGYVADDDEAFAGDDLHIAMTLISAHDGRVLWHVRENVDVEADQPVELEALFKRYAAHLPPSLAPPPAGAGAPAAPVPPPAPAPAPAPAAPAPPAAAQP